jgi:hypothetical protein
MNHELQSSDCVRLAADRRAAAEKLTTQTSDLEAQLGPWLALTRDLCADRKVIGEVSG